MVGRDEELEKTNKERSGKEKLIDLMHMAVVYGPPEYFRKKPDSRKKDKRDDHVSYPEIHAQPPKDGSDPDEPAMEEVYGPPEMYDNLDEPAMETIYGPPEMFEENGSGGRWGKDE